MEKPKWATPERQAYLVKLFSNSGGFCIYGHKFCLIESHHYEVYIETVIRNWISDDISERQALWQAERQQLHSLGERRYPASGQFNAISQDIFFASQPQYYYQGLGVSGLTFKPFVKIRIASQFMNLQVDISDTLAKLSKTKKRKAIRYGKTLPIDAQNEIDRLCKSAVSHYLKHR